MRRCSRSDCSCCMRSMGHHCDCSSSLRHRVVCFLRRTSCAGARMSRINLAYEVMFLRIMLRQAGGNNQEPCGRTVQSVSCAKFIDNQRGIQPPWTCLPGRLQHSQLSQEGRRPTRARSGYQERLSPTPLTFSSPSMKVRFLSYSFDKILSLKYSAAHC